MRFLPCLLILQLLFSPLHAQRQQERFRPLSVGESFPDLLIENILNSTQSTIDLSKQKDKLLIIDFFATWCGSCIAALPKLDTLQSELNKEATMLVVSYQESAIISDFLSKRLKTLNIGLPFVAGDTILTKLFPHRILPHTVWIYKGKVRAITHAGQVTRENIRALMHEDLFTLPVKKDIMDYDKKERLLAYDNGGTASDLLIQSSIIRYLPGISSGAGVVEEADNNLMRLVYTNTSILNLYAAIFPEAASNRVVLEVKNRQCFILDDPQNWELWGIDNCFTYEVIYRKDIAKEMVKKKMLQDFNWYFGLSAIFETRLVDCWILSLETKANKLLATTGRPAEVELFSKETSLKYMYNTPLPRLVKALNYQTPARKIRPIVVDETNYLKNIDIELPIKTPLTRLENFEELSKALLPYGLKLTKGKRLLKVLVIRDN